MDWLLRSTIAVRQAAKASVPGLLALAGAALVVQDRQSSFSNGLFWGSLAVLSAGSLVQLRHVRRRGMARYGAWKQIEWGATAAVLLFAGLERGEGGLSGKFYPLVFIFVAMVATFAQPVVAGAVGGLVLALEGAVRFWGDGETSFDVYGVHALFLASFAVLNVAFVRTEITRIRARSRARLDIEIGKMRESARSYRLLGASDDSRTMNEERLTRSSVEEIHEAVLFALDLVRRSLGLHTSLLLWLTESETHLRISEVSSAEDDLCEGPFLAGDGILGAAVARKATVMLQNLKPSYKLPYYPESCPVRTVCAVPVLDQDKVHGVLVADRRTGEPFSEAEQELLESATRYALRAIQNERLFLQLERAKLEQGKLYRASKALGTALTESEVVEAGVKSAREVALFDFAAVTLFDEATQTHEIRAVSGESVESILGTRFAHNSGLCSMVVHNRHCLPYRGEFDPTKHVLFAKKVPGPPLPSMLVLPLLVHERPLGTLVLGAKRKGAFGDAVRPTLEVLASHVAVSLSNARMLRKLEEMATTDGMTGLLNKRAMLDVANQKVISAKRFGRKLSVLVTDIDFFKKVNDTYGHDVGDVVIRGIGDILRRAKRTTDAVARFGGEEFVVVCEETDEKGAMLLAERVRLEVEQTVFSTPHGPLKVTCSVGVSTFPDAGQSWDALFKAADTALYSAKRGGRNRCAAQESSRKATALVGEGTLRA